MKEEASGVYEGFCTDGGVMPYLATADAQRVLDFANELASSATGDLLVVAALARLRELLHAEAVGFNQVRLMKPPRVQSSRQRVIDEQASEVSRLWRAHPAIRWYAVSKDWRPVRLSDIQSAHAWRSSEVYSVLFSADDFVNHLAIPVTSQDKEAGSGYGLYRSGRDFGFRELDMAAALQPVLAALHASLNAVRPNSGSDQPVRRVGLTSRETRILTFLAGGGTAVSIGRDCGISSRTVQKHLEHVYTKLGRHDRLSAVNEARRLGVLV